MSLYFSEESITLKIIIDKANALRRVQEEQLALFQEQLKQLLSESESEAEAESEAEPASTHIISEKKQSALQQAFQAQDFILAKKWTDSGAIIGPIEKAALEMALDSHKAMKLGFSPQSIISHAKEREPLHPMKEYGLTLGIKATSVDGTYSQFAHIGPSYQLMTEAVLEYANRHQKNDNFKNISEAFAFSNHAAHFSYSTSQNPQAGQAIADRIQEGKITTIPVSFAGHAMGLSIVPDALGATGGYMILTNRGLGATLDEHGTHIYRIDDLSKVGATFIHNMIHGHFEGQSRDQIMGQIQAVAGNRNPIHIIKQKTQKNDNCAIANTRANIHGILLCQQAIREKKPLQALSESARQDVKKEYKAFTDHMHREKIKKLANDLEKNPQDLDLRTLAQEYIRQHPTSKKEHKATLQSILGSPQKKSSEPVDRCRHKP